MRFGVIAAVAACLLLCRAAPAADKEAPEAAIKKVLDDQAKAWNKGDLKVTWRATGNRTS